MNKLKEIYARLTNYKSLMAIAGAVVVLLQVIGYKIETAYISDVVNAICVILILIGIMNKEGMDTIHFNK